MILKRLALAIPATLFVVTLLAASAPQASARPHHKWHRPWHHYHHHWHHR